MGAWEALVYIVAIICGSAVLLLTAAWFVFGKKDREK